MTRQVPGKSISKSEARAYGGKAEEHLEAARECLTSRMWTAATTLAVHAGINAADAITGMELGRRSSGNQHEQSLILLRETSVGTEVNRLLRPLLKIKPKAEYEPPPIRKTDAEAAVRRAESLVEIAREIASRP